MARLTGFLLILFGWHASQAQSSWTLQMCIDYALQNNLTIKQGQLAVKNSQVDLLQSKEAALPSASAFVGNGLNFGRNINPLDNTYVIQKVQSSSFGLNSQLILFSGFSISNSIKLSSINEEVSKKDLEVIANNISLQIATQFLQILFNKEAINVVKSRILSTEKQLETAKILFQAGNTNQSSVFELDAKLSSDKLDLVNAENSLNLSNLGLANLLQVPYDENFKIESPEVTIPEEINVEGTKAIYDNATKIMPEIELSILRHKASLMQQNVSKSGYYPSLSLGANINTLYSDNFVTQTSPGVFATTPFSKQFNNNLGQSLSLNLSVPLYSRGRTRGSVKQAGLATEQQKLNMQQAQNTLYTSVANAVANYKAAKAKYTALKEAAMSQQKNYEFNVQRFEAGALSSSDMLISKNNYEVAQANLVQGKYDLVFRKVLLDFYRGKPLVLK
ncbi:MAG: TolC family protein [Bacteroidia bacterium]